jgi:hypothetical protein
LLKATARASARGVRRLGPRQSPAAEELLREAGVIRQWDVGTRRLNALRRDDLDRRFPGLLDLAIAEGGDYRVRLLDA